MTRQLINGKPGLVWTATTDSPERALEHIVAKLKDRFNPVMSDRHFTTELGETPMLWDDGARTRLHIREGGNPIGHVALVYRGTTTDGSVPADPRTAQKFDVYFNLNPYGAPDQRRSYEERDFFAPR